MSLQGMSWSWKDEDGSGNIDQREFQENLREYHPQAGQRTGTDFVVPNAGPNHYFYTPVYDPFTNAKSDNHYKKLNEDWLNEDVREAGGGSNLISNSSQLQRTSPASGRRSRSSGRRSSRSTARSASASPAKLKALAGRTPWEPKLLEEANIDDDPTKIAPSKYKLRSGYHDKPRYRTQKELLAARAKEMRPDPSFDVDGDGVVSAQDFFLSNKFDVNNDGHLDSEEQHELRKKMVTTVVKNFEKVPQGSGDNETKQLVRAFTRDVDAAVRSKNFPTEFEKLYRKTAVSMTWDSHRLRDGLQPFDNAGGCEGPIRRSPVGKKGGPAYRTPTARERSPHKLPFSVDTARSNDSIDLDRGPEFLKGGERYKWSGFSSRADLLKARRLSTRAVTEQRNDERMRNHIIERNKVGANLPMPRTWHENSPARTSAHFGLHGVGGDVSATSGSFSKAMMIDQ